MTQNFLMLSFLCFLIPGSLLSQDKLILVEGDTLVGTIISVNQMWVKYENANGKLEQIERHLIRTFAFNNGIRHIQASQNKLVNKFNQEELIIPFGTEVKFRLKDQTTIQGSFSTFNPSSIILKDTILPFEDVKSMELQLDLDQKELKKRRSVGLFMAIIGLGFASWGIASGISDISNDDLSDATQHALLTAAASSIIVVGFNLRKPTQKRKIYLGKPYQLGTN